ncbi:MCE family protein [Gordonia aichiensis]|uniref:Mce family protein n=1 Tax=Gordonia aichiensis NBRC 108223 TaxID=1220583 RepID=L7KN89_9ACTN|nr:MlaD family protein [Gordonia aichiensis]GAC49168.1 Mce family protein [Gordonia aichiensis NBRC 108223]
MRSRLVRAQLIVFGVIALLAVGYAGYAYGGFQRYTGIGTYTVTAELRDGGGLYPNALVTYRGVDVGIVTALNVSGNGASAQLQIESDNKIPADTTAYVRSVSVAGEQFIDLVPTSSTGALLHDGSRITQSRTNIPIPATEVIRKVYGLLETVPKDSLHTVVDEASTAVDNVGPELNRALIASSDLVRRAKADITPTTDLIKDMGPVLGQLDASGAQISSLATDLNAFTHTLAMSDSDLQTALRTGTPFFETASETLNDLNPSLPILLANLQSVGEVLRVNTPALRHVLVVYPAATAAINAMHEGVQIPSDLSSGQGHLDIKLGNTGNPPPCTEGYQKTQRRDPSDVSPVASPDNTYCKLPKSDPRVVRGARNLPCATDPSVRTADIANCPGGLPSTWPQMLARPTTPDTAAAAPPKNRKPEGPKTRTEVAVPYDPETGKFTTPEGVTLQLGNLIMGPNDKGVKTQWQQLFPK